MDPLLTKIVLAAGLFELFYLWRRYRLSQIKLARHLREQGGFDPSEMDALAQPRAQCPTQWCTQPFR